MMAFVSVLFELGLKHVVAELRCRSLCYQIRGRTCCSYPKVATLDEWLRWNRREFDGSNWLHLLRHRPGGRRRLLVAVENRGVEDCPPKISYLRIVELSLVVGEGWQGRDRRRAIWRRLSSVPYLLTCVTIGAGVDRRRCPAKQVTLKLVADYLVFPDARVTRRKFGLRNFIYKNHYFVNKQTLENFDLY